MDGFIQVSDVLINRILASWSGMCLQLDLIRRDKPGHQVGSFLLEVRFDPI
jgi:hypothetical protein